MSTIKQKQARQLLLKLQNENRRSAFLNALPGKSSGKFDLAALDTLAPDLSAQLLDRLLHQNGFKLSLRSDPTGEEERDREAARLQRRLRNLYLRGKDIQAERGLHVLYIGYPLLQREAPRGDQGNVLAPLFLWQVYLEHSYNYARWSIRRYKSDEIKLNVSLKLFQQARGEMPIPDLEEERLTDGLLDAEEVQDYLDQLGQLESYPAPPADMLDRACREGLHPLPATRGELFSETPALPRYRIHNSAVLGLFRAGKEAIVRDLQQYLEQGDIPIAHEAVEIERFAAVGLDPSQLRTLESVRVDKNQVIHGPPGTGKSQVLTGIISAALSKGKKTLVVCEKITALEVLRNNLAALGFDQQAALISDVTRDRRQIVETARSLSEKEARQAPPTLPLDFIKDFHIEEERHHRHLRTLRKPVLYDFLWTDLVGHYLHVADAPEAELSASLLEQWRGEDRQLLEKLHQLEYYFQNLREPELFFRLIAPREEADEIRLAAEIDPLLRILGELAPQMTRTEAEAARELRQFFDRQLEQLEEQWQRFRTHVADWEGYKPQLKRIILYGGGLERWVNRLLTQRAYDAAKGSLQQAGWALEDFLKTAQKLDEAPADIGINYAGVDRLRDFLHRLRRHRAKLENDRDARWKAIARNLPAWEEKRQRLENRFHDALDPVHHLQRAVLLAGKKHPKKLLAGLQELRERLSEFEDFRRFREILQQLGIRYDDANYRVLKVIEGQARATKKALLKSAIEKSDTASILAKETTLEQLRGHLQKYRRAVQSRMQAAAYELKERGIAGIESEQIKLARLFNLRGSKGRKRNPLKFITQAFPKAFTDLFPVILTTPEVASTLFQGKRAYFDLVVFDEASQIRLEDAVCAMVKGKTIIVSGDEHQMPPSNLFAGEFEPEDDPQDELAALRESVADSESLLDYAINNLAFENRYLDFHYRSYHPRLIDFSNAAFYGRLLPIPSGQHYVPIEFLREAGVYRNRTNRQEAERVAEVLERIADTADGDLPAVGVATLNMQQRDLIFEHLGERAGQDETFARQLAGLEKAGLFVKNLENVQGDERDIMVISTTFGPDGRGAFRRNFGRLGQQNGYRLLNVLITRAKQKLVVVSSIPAAETRQYPDLLAADESWARGVFYAYLQYAEAVAQRNLAGVRRVLQHLYDRNRHQPPAPATGLQDAPFEEEVFHALRRTFSEAEIGLREQEGAFRVDLVVRPESAPGLQVAVECDGAPYPEGYANYHYDLHRQQILEQSGYRFVRVWSKNWFLNPDFEARKLILLIQDMAAHHAEKERALPPLLRPLFGEAVADTGGQEPPQATPQIPTMADAAAAAAARSAPVKDSLALDFGHTVTLHELTTDQALPPLVYAHENNLKEGCLGCRTPLGARLRGRKVGEEVGFNGYRYRVVSVRE